jgi:hypothetical protein
MLWPTTTEVGQDTVVEVDRSVTVIGELAELAAWTEVVEGVYAALTTALPAEEPVKLTLQLEAVALNVARTHLVGVNPPVAVLAAPKVKVTLPTGTDLVPASLSLTVAVHEDAWPTGTLKGAHTTTVVVRRPPVTFTDAVPKLVAWTAVATKLPRTVAAPVAVAVTLIVQLPAVKAQLAGPETPPV